MAPRRSVVVAALASVLLIVTGTPTALAQDASGTIAFVGATVIDPAQDHAILDGTVVVADGKIQTVTSGREAIPADAMIVDVSGKYLVPGLIDAHVHISDLTAARRQMIF